VTEGEKKFVFAKIGKNAFSPYLQSLWEQLEVINEFVKPAKKE